MVNLLEGYETVAERIEKFWNAYPMGRISSTIVFQDGTRYIIQTDLYRDINDPLPFATDYAEEIRSNANRFPLENCSTSSIGRSLHSGGLSKFSEGVNRASLEEMKRVERPIAAPMTASVEMTVTESRDPWSFGSAIENVGNAIVIGENLDEAPKCVHGHRLRKEGVGKTGAPYKGWVCSEKSRANQCPAIWD
jgi:hypothetical protein